LFLDGYADKQKSSNDAFLGIFWQKENQGVPHSSAVTEKKRKVAANGVEGENNSLLLSETLCSSNGQAESCVSQQEENQANSIKNWEEGKMTCEQVEALLSTKILGKTKFDLKVPVFPRLTAIFMALLLSAFYFKVYVFEHCYHSPQQKNFRNFSAGLWSFCRLILLSITISKCMNTLGVY
jgi:hypothetical protein